MTDPTHLPPLTPMGPGPTYTDLPIWLPQLFAETARGGKAAIENRTFIKCRFEGPAVILPIDGCNFDACNMGESAGDVRNLLWRPVSLNRAIGAIPFRNCTFRECMFYMVGFTGPEAFLEEFAKTVGGTPA